MTAHDTAAEKRIVDDLTFGAKTSKRVTWEQFEFTIEGPHLVRVTNASYGFEKDDHSYLVGVEARDGRLLPAECECKADRYNDDYDCKHKVALALIGGPVVLQAAVDYPAPESEEGLLADGGAITGESGDGSPALYEDERDECDCADLPDDFPCWSCVKDGQQGLPE